MYRLLASITILSTFSLNAKEPKFRQQDIDVKVGVGYGLQLADMNGDAKTDIVLVDKDKVAWYQNPTWTKHRISGHLTERDHVCVAARDLDQGQERTQTRRLPEAARTPAARVPTSLGFTLY